MNTNRIRLPLSVKWGDKTIAGRYKIKEYKLIMRRNQIMCPVSRHYDEQHIKKYGYKCSYKHASYFWPGMVNSESTIIRDSICKFVNKTNRVLVQAFPGMTLQTLLNKLLNNVIKVSDFRIIIIHVGTNNIHDVSITAERFIILIKEIVQIIRLRNPSALIAVSGLVPRPCDRGTNQQLKLLGKQKFCYILYTWRAFLKKTEETKQPDLELFSHTDKLHLSRKGTLAIKKYLVGSVNQLQQKIKFNS